MVFPLPIVIMSRGQPPYKGQTCMYNLPTRDILVCNNLCMYNLPTRDILVCTTSLQGTYLYVQPPYKGHTCMHNLPTRDIRTYSPYVTVSSVIVMQLCGMGYETEILTSATRTNERTDYMPPHTAPHPTPPPCLRIRISLSLLK